VRVRVIVRKNHRRLGPGAKDFAVASAANLNGEAESPAMSPLSAAPRRDAVALEVAVNATGARPTQGNASRELFSEDTATVLLFHDGAVIRLSSAVQQGQLIFLTHKRSNREVVSQVVRTRASASANSYVELQFTEPQDDFWGISFEEFSQAVPPQPAPMPSAAAAAAAAEATEFVLEAAPAVDGGGSPSAAPSPAEVEHLREEVEALRKQLLSLQSAPAAPAPPLAPIIPMSLPAATSTFSQEVPREQAPSSSSLSEPRFTEDVAADPDSQQNTMEGLLPALNLDFSTPPAKANAAQNASAAFAVPGPRSGRVLIVLVSLLLAVGALGVAWSLGLIPLGHHTAEPAAKIASTPKTAAKPATAAAPAPTPSASTTKPPAPQIPESPSGFSSSTSSEAAPANSSPSEKLPADPSVGSDGAAKQPAKDSSNSRALARGAKPTAASSASLPARSEAVTDDAPLVPAQLQKSVTPVYPPDAMRNFITGDVRLDALVDSKGHVKSAEVLAGPSPLRQAAIDAIKQYQYSPATRGPRPVDSHVTVTIKFWYNP